MSEYSRRLKEILRKHGCEFVRQGKGSHEIWRSPHAGIPFTLASNCPSRQMANVILKKAGIKERV